MTDFKCPKCKGAGVIVYVEDGVDYAKPCECVAVRNSQIMIAKSGLAKDFESKSFDNFNPCGKSQLADAKKTAVKFTKKIISGEDNCPWMMLCGQVGAGKTHLGTACCSTLMNNGFAVVYMPFRESMTFLKTKLLDSDVYGKEIEKYKTTPVLYIDDFLKGKTTESDVNILFEILNYRYQNDKTVILSTEKNLNELIRFDEAIASRLIQKSRGYIVELKGKELNYRLYGCQ